MTFVWSSFYTKFQYKTTKQNYFIIQNKMFNKLNGICIINCKTWYIDKLPVEIKSVWYFSQKIFIEFKYIIYHLELIMELLIQNIGIPEHWNTRTLEYQNIVIPEYWNTRTLLYQNIGIPEHCYTRILEYQNIGIPEHWKTRTLE